MKYKLFLIILLITASATFGQWHKGKGRGRYQERIEALEKVKLMEILDLDEETTLKFFSRRNEHKKTMRAIMQERDKLVLSFREQIIEEEIEDEKNYSKNVNRILELEKTLTAKRAEFITSLDDILTEKQIAMLVVFEFRFRKDLSEMINRHRRGWED